MIKNIDFDAYVSENMKQAKKQQKFGAKHCTTGNSHLQEGTIKGGHYMAQGNCPGNSNFTDETLSACLRANKLKGFVKLSGKTPYGFKTGKRSVSYKLSDGGVVWAHTKETAKGKFNVCEVIVASKEAEIAKVAIYSEIGLKNDFDKLYINEEGEA